MEIDIWIRALLGFFSLLLCEGANVRRLSTANATSETLQITHVGHAQVNNDISNSSKVDKTMSSMNDFLNRTHNISTDSVIDTDSQSESHGIHVAKWNYAYVEEPFIISAFLLLAGICKLGFHRADFLPTILPESCLLIILGVLVGLILHLTHEDTVFPIYLTPRLFFLFLLPPIILESAYSLHDRVFFENVGTVLLFAGLGTVLNFFIIGPLMYVLAESGAMGDIHITLSQCFLFSSLIVAVDPVAVLAIFQEIGVNNVLYFLVFGESLLNDAVTVVLYNMMKEFNNMDEIAFSQILLGVCAFFTVSVGGLFVGLLMGVLTAIVTKYTVNVRVVEPLAIFVLAYLSFLLAEMFHFSGIISIIGCGLTQANYAFHNVSEKTNTTVKYFTKMLSSTCDCIIFLFLGMTLFRGHLLWHTGFVLWSLLLCLLVRFMVVFALTFLANKVNRLKKIDLEEQFIMAYGGLRGAVCFSLVDMLDPHTMKHKDMFLTTTLAVVFFTVFVQGISIKPLVKFFRIRLQEKETTFIYEEINYHVTDHVMAGIEEVLGRKGQHFWREMLEYYDDKYLRNLFQRSPSKTDERIMAIFEEILLRQHFENLSSGQISKVGLYFSDEEDGESIYEGRKGDTSASGHLGQSQEGAGLPTDEIQPYNKGDDVKKRSRAKSLIPAIKEAEKRRESRGRIFRQTTIAEPFWGIDETLESKRRPSKMIDKPTAHDIRKILAQNPALMLHQDKADKNLKREGSVDIVHLLREKQARTNRMCQNVGSHYDGIFQGALLRSEVERPSPEQKRNRAHSSFTPAEVEQMRELRKKRLELNRAATVGYQDPRDFDCVQIPHLNINPSYGSGDCSSEAGIILPGQKSSTGSSESLNKRTKREKERARKWRHGRMEKTPALDEPLLEETIPDEQIEDMEVKDEATNENCSEVIESPISRNQSYVSATKYQEK